MCQLLVALIFVASASSSLAQQAPPHLTLRLDVSRATGVIAARACLSRLPTLPRYEFILHRGLNIKSIRNGAGRLRRYGGYEDGRFVGEGVVYRVLDSIAATDSLCVEYGGAFPVYTRTNGDFNTQDYKGHIAFNEMTVRAAEQAKWYPLLYDSTQGARAYEAVSFRAMVRCPDCRAIYLNGDQPKPGPEAAFGSNLPVPMLLFAGDIHTQRLPGLTALNGTLYPLPRRTVERLAVVVDSVRSFYEAWLGVPYGPQLVFLQHTITEDNPRRRWGFVTYPTIAFSNDGITAFVDTTGSVVPFVWGYLGHEMAHYYFGTLLIGRGPYTWFLGESTAEYLALKTVRRFQGDSTYFARIGSYAREALADSTSVPFDRITAAAQVTRPLSLTLLLVALEEMAGIDRIRELLAAMLREPDRTWNYAAFREAALAAGVSSETWSQFEARCVRPRFADGCLARYAGR